MEQIVVDILPKTAEDCPYSKYWRMTNKYECAFKQLSVFFRDRR